MRPEDTEAAAAIENENFSRPWKKQGFLDAVCSPNALYFVAEQEGEIVGYAGLWVALDEGEITNVSVKPPCWGQHVGRKLMNAMLEAGNRAGVVSFFLEVRESNVRAISLYTSCGFEAVGVRKNLYEAPTENGIIMCKLCNSSDRSAHSLRRP